MFDWQAKMGQVAGLFSILCFIPYILTTLQGKTKPNRATWWIWVVLSTVISFSHYSSGALNTIWLPICGGIGQFIIAILSLKYGEGGWNRLDRFCLVCVGFSLILWWQFNVPLVALLLSILIDCLGALPTIKKTYHKPETEDCLTWILYLLGSTFNLFAIERWSFALSIFPIYIFSINVTMVALVLRPTIQKRINYYKRQTKRKFGKYKKQ
jgi:hypothetical protein